MLSSLMLNDIIAGPGYSLCLQLASVRVQWLDILTERYPQHSELFNTTDLFNYHTLDSYIDHKSLWTKQSRILPPSVISMMKEMPFYRHLYSLFRGFRISNEEQFQTEEVYWRIVRPLSDQDIGPLHADKWFWDLGHGVMPPDHWRLKVWIPLYCEPGKSGLRVVPYSHQKNYSYSHQFRDGMNKPLITTCESELNILLLDTQPGQIVVFNDTLIHGGAPSSDFTRFSIEFTMLIPN